MTCPRCERIYCRCPSMQNIPIKSDRPRFKPCSEPPTVFCNIDYSGLEMRMAAFYGSK